MTDDRVTEFWDAEGVLGDWFGQHREQMALDFFGGAVVWDASLLFGPEAVWEEVPQPLEAFGYTIIADRDTLQQTLETIWAG